MMRKMNFEAWFKAVDRAVWNEAGVSVHDLADALFVDMYEDGFSPKAAALDTLRADGWGG